MPPYSGMWKNTAYQDPRGPTLHTADPQHANRDTPDPQRAVHQAPALPDPGAADEYPGMSWVIDGGGVQLDHTDYSDHEGVGTAPTYTDLVDQAADSAGRHQVDEGRPAQTSRVVPTAQAVTEHYHSDRSAGIGPGATEVSTVALQRGLNGLAENNPDGFRAGYDTVWWVDRKFMIGERRHDARPLYVNTAAAPENTPPVSPGTPYTSPFASLARGIPTIWQRPQLRREPVGISRDVVRDGAADATPDAGAYFEDGVILG